MTPLQSWLFIALMFGLLWLGFKLLDRIADKAVQRMLTRFDSQEQRRHEEMRRAFDERQWP
jgi:hypothetical protein